MSRNLLLVVTLTGKLMMIESRLEGGRRSPPEFIGVRGVTCYGYVGRVSVENSSNDDGRRVVHTLEDTFGYIL